MTWALVFMYVVLAWSLSDLWLRFRGRMGGASPGVRSGQRGRWLRDFAPVVGLYVVILYAFHSDAPPEAFLLFPALHVSFALGRAALARLFLPGPSPWHGLVLELGSTGAHVLALWTLTQMLFAGSHLLPNESLLALLASVPHFAAWALVAGLGQDVVRLVLEGARAIPPASQAGTVQGATLLDAEPRLGRVIGVLERLLVVTLVLNEAWAGIGLILAAKSIARFKELEERRFSEYYLVGTLASVFVAIVVGAFARAIMFH